MNLLRIHYFLKVSETRNFTHAARQLYVSQQSLSKQIAALEEEVDAVLFKRSTPLQLTQAGEIFYRYAKAVLRLHHDMRNELADAADPMCGTLTIGVAHTRGRLLVPELLETYHRLYPRMQINLHESCNSDVFQQLLDRNVDCVVSRGTPVVFGIETVQFYDEEVSLLLPDALLRQLYGDKTEVLLSQLREKLDFNLLANCPFLLLKEGEIIHSVAELLFAECSFTPRVYAHAEHLDTLLDLCSRGLGAMFCPSLLLRSPNVRIKQRQMPPQLHAIHIDHPQARYSVNLSYPANAYLNAALQAFINTAMEIGTRMLNDGE
ncbi:LysR family transcriptional regulator [Lutispora saccharofermentans]|uniref:LysR family transcriptional regulator n=1 Tax=Lutispora saccharofermentans TaxID=3024236 RepID=A0ABT1NIV8_9FIRM|nr:LysR family transcriptional regulator [Lutispora saccharofermentans]MCQ1531215.1 LysR family transcriptional regulator [Lutispora saccharofermentans]